MNASVTLLDKVSAATVGIHSLVPPNHPSTSVGLGTDRRGTGTLVSADGLVLTANYVLMGAHNIMVTLTGGKQYQARITAQDFSSGLGLLRIDGDSHSFLEPVSSKGCSLGQEIFTVAGVGHEARRADSGMITYLGAFDAVWEFTLDRCIMASAMNLGFGGGPVCDARGQLIGVGYLGTTEIARSILAIPAEYFLDCRDELLKHGRRVNVARKAWLGLLSYTMQDHVVIAGVLPGGPSEKAGLCQGDIIIEIEGREISERRAFYEILKSHRPGDSLSLKVLRESQIKTVQIASTGVEDYFA